MHSRFLSSFQILLWIAIGAPLIAIPLLHWGAVSKAGGEGLLWFQIPFALPMLWIVLAVPLSLILLLFRKTRWPAAKTIVLCVAYYIAFFAASAIGWRIRMAAFHRLAVQSQPLVNAIKAYEQTHKAPPPSLEALMPEYLREIPTPEIGARRKYQYQVSPTNWLGNPWVLTVFTPSGGINFDQFLYFPLTNYPAQGFGGSLERVGDWAYVHE